MTEVTIYGAGIFGLSVAWVCLQHGAKVLVIDPNGVGAGASGGIVGALAPHTPELWNDKKAFQLDSLLMAEDFWASVVAAGGGDPGYGRIGRLQAIADDRALEFAHARTVEAQTLWQGRAEWRVIPASDAPDWSPASASGYVIFDTLAARLHPLRACQALAAAIRTRGGQIVTEAPESHPANGPVVWATGLAGLVALGDDLGQMVGNGVKGQALLLDHDVRDQPQIFTDGIHFVPHNDGTLAVGSTSERYFDNATETDDQLEALLARARAAMPQLASAPVLQRWAGVRPRARSRAPMLGQWPGRAGHFVANGGFKIGFGMAPKVGQIMADLILDSRDSIPPGFRVVENLPKSART